MRPGVFLFLWVLCMSLVCWEFGSIYVNGSQVNDFLNQKEDQVKRIAALSTSNEANTCELVANCSVECSRRTCVPLQSDDLTCTFASENTACTNKSGALCQDIRANFLMSYSSVSAELVPFSGATDDVSFEVQNSVCSQRRLDPLFKELQKLQNPSLYYFNFYFGSVDGTFRFYPGVETQGSLCVAYDPRIRPWYTGAISVLKDLVIVLDTGFTMSNYLESAVYQVTTLSAAQSMAEQLVMTLTPNDRVTIVTFNDSDEAETIASYVVPNAGLNVTERGFVQLLVSVNSTTASSGSAGVNFTAAFDKSLSIFNESSPHDSLKIVVLFTDGLSSTTEDLHSISQLFLDRQVRLFLYEIVDSSSGPVSQLACTSKGRSERLNTANVILNPLFAINSFFTYLAHAQAESEDGVKPFWQRVYPDAGTLGSVITVAYPALSADKSRLIGVAGIDVQVDGLGLNFKNLLDVNLVNYRRTSVSKNANATIITPCNPVYNDSLGQCSSSNVAFSPFCKQDDNSSRFEDLVCCADCGLSMDPSQHSKSKNFVIPLIVLPVLALFSAISAGIFFLSRYKACCITTQEPKGRPDPLKIPRFSYQALSVSTANFSAKRTIGSGNYGKVFKGNLPNGTPVAIKKLYYRPGLPDSDADFEAEIKVLATANHMNLVALKGFCDEPENLLVYEFVENSDLQAWLFGDKVLPWDKRVIIAQGVARGLNYLHRELQNSQVVCHSDIKPANILLDADFHPKVADFGMATLYDRGAAKLTRGGTFGYTAPEILEGSAPATTWTDVFSYGMVLLEMVTGRKAEDPTLTDFAVPGLGGPLRGWVDKNVADGTEEKIIDRRLGKLKREDERMAKILIKVALQCTSRCATERPDMSKVIQMIEAPSL